MPGVARLGVRKRKDKVVGKKITREQVEEVAELVNQWVAENLELSSGVAVITADKSAKYWEC